MVPPEALGHFVNACFHQIRALMDESADDWTGNIRHPFRGGAVSHVDKSKKSAAEATINRKRHTWGFNQNGYGCIQYNGWVNVYFATNLKWRERSLRRLLRDIYSRTYIPINIRVFINIYRYIYIYIYIYISKMMCASDICLFTYDRLISPGLGHWACQIIIYFDWYILN